MNNEKLKGVFSHASDHWRTPSDLYALIMARGFVDPCPFKFEGDNLTKNYYNVPLFINPPYSNIKGWAAWAIQQARNGCKVWLLIPARTDTAAFRALFMFGARFFFISGRLHFNDSKGGGTLSKRDDSINSGKKRNDFIFL